MMQFLTGIWGKVAAGALAVLAILGAILKIRSDGVKWGEAKQRAKEQEALNKAIEDRRKSDEAVDGLSDNAVRDRLREKWSSD